MLIDIRPMGPHDRAVSSRIQVFLDGQKVEDAVAANTVEGWVERTGHQTGRVERDENGNPKTKREHGEVLLRIADRGR